MGLIKAVIIIDKDITDIWLTTKMLKAINPALKLIVALNGDFAIKKLRQTLKEEFPELIFIDSSTIDLIELQDFVIRIKGIANMNSIDSKMVLLCESENLAIDKKVLKYLGLECYMKPLSINDLVKLIEL